MIQCPICKAKITSADNFTLRKCKHVYCIECLNHYIEKNFGCKIKCPLLACKEYIQDQIIRKCLSSEKIEEYEKLSVLAASPEAMKCLTKDCPNIMIVKGNDTIFHCSYCDQPNCVKCKHRHYGNDACVQDINEDVFDEAAAQSIGQNKRKELVSEYSKDELVTNPESFNCEICLNFILPREGMITRNCHHSICKICFKEAMTSVKFIDKLICPKCDEPLNERDKINAIGTSRLMELNMKKARPKLFNCQSPGCSGMWDRNNWRGSFICPECNSLNCMDCEDIHEKMSCEKFRITKRYKDAQQIKKKFEKSVQCICGQKLIRKGGCNAIHCNSCDLDICLFTGKLAGDRGKESCGCRTDAPCHRDCRYGCLPD